MERKKGSLARRLLSASATAILLAGVVGGPVGAARPTTGGPSISAVTYDPVVPCKIYVTYTATRGKFAQIDLWARTLGYTSPSDTSLGYDIWAGSEHRNGPIAGGTYTAAFQLAAGGRQKEFTTWGWAYRIEGVTLDRTLSPTYSFRSTCVMPNFDYTVKFHDGYTSGDAGYISAYQQRVKFGQLITEPTPPTRAGYGFTGWLAYDYGYLGPNPTSLWDFSTDRMRDYDPLVMYAQWAEIIPGT